MRAGEMFDNSDHFNVTVVGKGALMSFVERVIIRPLEWSHA